jgi:hypothetical protein
MPITEKRKKFNKKRKKFKFSKQAGFLLFCFCLFIVVFVLFCFVVVLGFELRTSCLLGRQATLPALGAFFVWF